MATKKTGSVGSLGTFGVSSTKTAVSNSKKSTETQRKNQNVYNIYENTQKLINDSEQKALADAQAKQEQQLAESKAAYEAQYNAYMSQIQQQAAAQKAYYQKMYDENAANINQNYDRSANTAYIQYRQGQKELPEQLSNLGATGGASESANIRLQSEYGTNLANNEYARNSDIAMAKQGMIEGQANVDSQANSNLANAYWQNLNNQMSAEESIINSYNDSIAAIQLDARNRRIANKENLQNNLGYTTSGYTDPSTGNYHYLFTNPATQLAEQKAQAEAQAQSEALYNAYAQAYNTAANAADAGYSTTIKTINGIPYTFITSKKNSNLNSSGSSGGSSSSKSSGSSKSYGTSNSSVKTYTGSTGSTAFYKTLQTNIANYMLKGNTTEKQLDRYTDQIEASYNAGKITERQAKSLLNLLK